MQNACFYDFCLYLQMIKWRVSPAVHLKLCVMNHLLHSLFAFVLTVSLLVGGNVFGQYRELPDNIQSANCTFAPEATEWGIQEKWSSTDNVSTLINPLVGDINNDGVPEIVCFAPLNQDFYNVNTVLVFNTRNHSVIHTFTILGNVSTVDAAPYGMVKLHNGHVLLAVCAQNNNMYGYDLTANGTTPLWTTSTGFPAPNVGFVDFNGDGYPEIYVGNKVFDAETGVLLVTNASVTRHQFRRFIRAYGQSQAAFTLRGQSHG